MPYQIIHTFDGFLANQDGTSIVLGRGEAQKALSQVEARLVERLNELKARGIDGLVVNVGGSEYLESAEGWELFLKGLEVAIKLGFRLWIYDEQGYPSGSAGGLTLRGAPELEARGVKAVTVAADNGRAEFGLREKGDVSVLRCEALYEDGRRVVMAGDGQAERLEAWSAAREVVFEDKGLAELRIFYIAALFEGAHASRNYGEKRRYINLLDSRAVKRFIELTHERYARAVPKESFDKIEAFFTDEPSFMSVVLRDLDGDLATPIPVRDQPDPSVPILPSVPYSEELSRELRERYDLKLADIADDLFEYDKHPSAVKCAFWEAASLVYERAYAMQLAEACARLGKKLTGHVLFEETPFVNMIFHANPFRALKHFQLPGVDLLTNVLENISVFSHKLPFSCAFLTGKPGIMDDFACKITTETSDFSEYYISPKKPATPEVMAAALSMQFLLGVREFSYYYDLRARSAEEYRWVNDVVQRTCDYGGSWRYAPQVALYCPYETFWSGYTPTNTIYSPESIKEQPAFLQRTEAETLRLCDELFRRNVQFVLCDCSSVQQLIATGVKKVIIPECLVVSQDLVEAGRSGALELYGHVPESVYSQGRLTRIEGLTVRPQGELDLPAFPFGYEEGLWLAAFERNRFYCFNPTDHELALQIRYTTSAYDPFEGSSKMLWPGKTLRLGAGRAEFLSL